MPHDAVKLAEQDLETDSIPSIFFKFYGSFHFQQVSFLMNSTPPHAVLAPCQGVEFGGSSNFALRHRASTLRFVGRSSEIRFDSMGCFFRDITGSP